MVQTGSVLVMVNGHPFDIYYGVVIYTVCTLKYSDEVRLFCCVSGLRQITSLVGKITPENYFIQIRIQTKVCYKISIFDSPILRILHKVRKKVVPSVL